MKKASVFFACLGIVFAFGFAQKVWLPKNVNDGEVVYYFPDGDLYHFPGCTEIAGKTPWSGSLLFAKTIRGLKPCPKCSVHEVDITVKAPAVDDAAGQVMSVSGSSNKNTETFTIGSAEWVISWSTTGDSNFAVWLYNANTNESIDLVTNIVGSGRDSSVMRGRGRYYLKISSSQPYSIIVSEKK